MEQNRLRVPERRYDIEESSDEVRERVKYALGDTATTVLNIRLADIYEGELPIPDEILQGEIEFSTDFLSRAYRGGLRAVGRTPDSSVANITITIPADMDERSTLRLLEITPSSLDSEE